MQLVRKHFRYLPKYPLNMRLFMGDKSMENVIGDCDYDTEPSELLENLTAYIFCNTIFVIIESICLC